MCKFKQYIQILLLICILSSGLRAQFDPTCAARLQTVLDSMRIAQNISRGVSAAVIIPGAGIWQGVSGFSYGNVNITTGMKFCIGSNTKLFVSVLMLKLAEMNILSLDDSLHEWLPNFQYVNPNITIRQLLNHTSGIYNIVENPAYAPAMNADTSRRWSFEELWAAFDSAAYFNPGQGYHYSNTNYILAGKIIKAATDTTVSYKMRQLILNPLNLSSTFFPLEEVVPDTIARGWAGGIEYSYPWTSWNSSQWCFGNMYSTAENMVKWYDSLFARRVINQSSLNQLLTFTTQSGYYYGLGIYRVTPVGRPKWQHDGLMQKGFRSVTRIDSASRYIISVLINQYVNPNQPDPFAIANALDNVIRTLSNCWSPTGANQNNELVPKTFQLYQNYPNPFNPVTRIKFSIPPYVESRVYVNLVVYDVLGRDVITLVNEQLNPGNHEIDWDATNFPSGVYLYRLTAGDYNETRKMLLLK